MSADRKVRLQHSLRFRSPSRNLRPLCRLASIFGVHVHCKESFGEKNARVLAVAVHLRMILIALVKFDATKNKHFCLFLVTFAGRRIRYG